MKIVSLYDRSMNAVEPWAKAGFECVCYDIAGPMREPPLGVKHIQCDITTLETIGKCDFVVAFPPCTHLARSGARHWKAKGDNAVSEAMDTVNAAIRLAGDVPMILENPLGRLDTLWKPHSVVVNPWYFDIDGTELFTKRTCLWLENGAYAPVKTVNEIQSLNTDYICPIDKRERGAIASITPVGMSLAIFKANGARLLKGLPLDNGKSVPWHW